MKYKVIRTAKADEQLHNDILYIAQDSGSVEIALNYLDKVESAVELLQTTPYIGSQPRYATLRRQGYLVLIVERHLVFYQVFEKDKTVVIYAVVDGRREYKNMI